MFANYKNESYELNGNWNSTNYQILLWFPVSGISLRQKESFDGEERTRRLMSQLRILMVSPNISMVDDDIDTAITDQVPETEKNPEQFEIDALIVVSGGFMSQKGKAAMHRCGQMIEDIYSDQMLERVQS